MFSLALLTSPPSVSICGRRWEEEPEQWTGYKGFIFFLCPRFVLRAKYRVSPKALEER